MSRKPFPLTLIPAIALLAFIPGCSGGMNRTLDSISIFPITSNNAPFTYRATGTYNTSPMTVNPQSVSWYIMGPGIDPPPAAYSLATAAYTAQRCVQIQNKNPLTYTVIALAPADPAAPNSGPVPSQVFEDLVITHTMTMEGGYVSAAITVTCP